PRCSHAPPPLHRPPPHTSPLSFFFPYSLPPPHPHSFPTRRSSDLQITLTAAEQAVYQKAMRLADEHGPCCCHCWRWSASSGSSRSEEHTSELQSRGHLVCRLLLEKKKKKKQ